MLAPGARGTTLVENPDVIQAACRTEGDRSFLAVSVRFGGRAEDVLSGALRELDRRGPGWGLHPLDINLTLDDLIEIVSRQSKVWAAGRR